MIHLLENIPSYVYVAGIVGATVTYVLFPSSSNSRSRSRNAALNGYPRGLINYKNECFMNVILQSLSASQKVTDWLIRSKSLLTSATTSSFSLLNTLASTVASINRIELLVLEEKNTYNHYDKDQSEIYAAHFVKRALNSHNWHIESEEHDCHEFFTLLMDVLDEEQQESNNSQRSLNFFQPPSHLKDVSRSAVKNPFHGYLACQLQCLDCNYKYPLKLESFYVLSLTIPQTPKSPVSSNDIFSSMSSVSLYECLNNYFKTELITEMRCENCNACSKESNSAEAASPKNTPPKGFIKRQAIAKLPECLCIQIQRNSWSDQSGEMIKRTNHVKFPLSIKIDNFSPHSMCSACPSSMRTAFSLKQVGIGALLGGQVNDKRNSFNSQPNSPRVASPMSTPNLNSPNLVHSYELRSAIVHYGSAHSGHFVAFRKPLNATDLSSTSRASSSVSTDDWLQISDSDIKKVKQSTLLNSNVYMLFYDKVSSMVLNAPDI